MDCRAVQILFSILAVFLVTAVLFSHKKEERYKAILASAESNHPLRYEAGDCIEIHVRNEYRSNPEKYEPLESFEIQPGFYKITGVSQNNYESDFFKQSRSIENPERKMLSFVLLDLLNSPTKIKGHIDCKIMEQMISSGLKD